MLQPSVMLVDDNFCLKCTSNFHKKEDIIKEADNYGGAINLHQKQNKFVSDNDFSKGKRIIPEEGT